MNRLKCVGTVSEINIKPSEYTTKMWIDGEKTDKNMTIHSYFGRLAVEINGHIVEFEVSAQDASPFSRSGQKPRIPKDYDNIKKFLENIKSGNKIRIVGEAIDSPYYNKTTGEIVESTKFKANFISIVDDSEEDDFFLNVTTFIRKYTEDDNEEGKIKLVTSVAPSWGKAYFPLRSSNKDSFVYTDQESLEAILEECSDDGDTMQRSMLGTYTLKFVHKGGNTKATGKTFGSYKKISSGWEERELWLTGGEFIDPIMVEKENEDGEVIEVCTNANDVIFRKDLKPANTKRQEKLATLKQKTIEKNNKKETSSVDDLDDLM